MALLVPIDLTAPSRSAVQIAVAMGTVLGEDALLLHVTVTPPSLDALANLHAIATPIREAGMGASLRTVAGDPATCIAEMAQARQCSWIVMGTHGTGSARQPGSVARAVMLGSGVPVTAVRPGDVGAGFSLDQRAIAVVSRGPDTPSESLAAALASRSNSVVRRYVANPDPTGPLLLPKDGLEASDFAFAVICFDPLCREGDWCDRLIQHERRLLVLVARGPSTIPIQSCASAQPGV